MALLTTQLTAITLAYIRPKLVDNVFLTYPLLEAMRKRMNLSQKGGTLIQQPIIYAKKTSVGIYSGWSTLLTAVNDSVTGVQYNWGHYYANMGIARTDELKNAGVPAILKLLTAEAQSAEMTLSDYITQDLFATSLVTGHSDSLYDMCGTSGTFGGISNSDVTTWAAGLDTTTNVLTIGGMKVLMGKATYGSNKPNILVSRQSVNDKFYQLCEVKPEFRVQDNESGNLKFDGAEWIVDRSCNGSDGGTANNAVYMLNDKFIEFYIHPEDNFEVGEWKKPINQQGRIAQVTATLSLGTSNRRMHAMFQSIDPNL